MPFQWSIPPYRFKEALVAEYTTAVVIATRKRAAQYAVEAEEWMKENAPWTDRTEEEHNRLAPRFRSLQGMGSGENIPHARAGLRVRLDDEGEQAAYEKRYAAAQQIDVETLKKLNSERLVAYKAADKLLTQQSQVANLTGRQIGLARERIEKRFSPLASLPKSQSLAQQVTKEFRSQRLPIVNLVFSYHPRTWYAVWLEIANGGRYAILAPAMERYSQKLFNEVKSIVNLKQFRDRLAFTEVTTPQQRFEEHVQRWEAASGKAYPEWSPAKMQGRRGRRKYYDYNKAVQWRARRLAEEFEEQQSAYTRDRRAGLRRYQEPAAPQTMNIRTVNRRSLR